MIKLVIADDQMLTREGLRTILDLEDDMEVVGLARNGKEAIELVKELGPDLVMMDVQMPVMDGISALKAIKQLPIKTSVLILSTFLDDDYIIEGMANGASGYLLKDMEADKMIAAIRDAITGQFILPTAVAARLATRLSHMNVQKKSALIERDEINLTDREVELARLIVSGLNNREIASKLHIAEGTTRNYISNLYSELGVIDRMQAVEILREFL
ncbi:response regulator [Paenibacillus sp. FA6]|uniref:response regulator n=1 Tax=Paenibacillus sp. FA6 TaxID=3413029 RepID=UPI003F65F9A3